MVDMETDTPYNLIWSHSTGIYQSDGLHYGTWVSRDGVFWDIVKRLGFKRERPASSSRRIQT